MSYRWFPSLLRRAPLAALLALSLLGVPGAIAEPHDAPWHLARPLRSPRPAHGPAPGPRAQPDLLRAAGHRRLAGRTRDHQRGRARLVAEPDVSRPDVHRHPGPAQLGARTVRSERAAVGLLGCPRRGQAVILWLRHRL